MGKTVNVIIILLKKSRCITENNFYHYRERITNNSDIEVDGQNGRTKPVVRHPYATCQTAAAARGAYDRNALIFSRDIPVLLHLTFQMKMR